MSDNPYEAPIKAEVVNVPTKQDETIFTPGVTTLFAIIGVLILVFLVVFVYYMAQVRTLLNA